MTKRKITYSIYIALAFSLSLFASLVTDDTASAAGETFRWSSSEQVIMNGWNYADYLADGSNTSPLHFQRSGTQTGVLAASRSLTFTGSHDTSCSLFLEIVLPDLSGTVSTSGSRSAPFMPHRGDLRMNATRDGDHPNCLAVMQDYAALEDGSLQNALGFYRSYELDGEEMHMAGASNLIRNLANWMDVYSSAGCSSQTPECTFNQRQQILSTGQTRSVSLANWETVIPSISRCATDVRQGRFENIDSCIRSVLEGQNNDEIDYGEGGTTSDSNVDGEYAGEGEDANVCRGGGLGWITCPFVALMAGAIEGIANVMDMLLFVEPLDLSTESPMYQLWSIFRNIANVVFIIVFLVVIFSQVTSMGLSNYGIKSILPRLVIAAILVNVSYFVCAIAIDVFNILGSGIEGIMQAGINAVPDPQSNAELGIDWSRGWGSIISVLMAILITGGTVLAGILLGAQVIPIILSALLAIALPVLIAFAIIVLRHVFIILLVLLSPLAFVSMLLPGTNNFYSKWQNAFLTILFMYPIIMLALFGSILGAKIILTVNYTTDWLGFVLALLTLAAGPVVVIAAPKLAGALLSRFTGFINNPSKGLIDKAKNTTAGWRADQQGAAAASFKSSKNTFFRGMRQRIRSGYTRTGAGKARNEAIVQKMGDEWEGKQMGYAKAALDQMGILNNRTKLKEIVNSSSDEFMQSAAMKAIGESGGVDELQEYLNGSDAVKRKMAAKAAVSSPAIKQMGTALSDQSQAYLELLNEHPEGAKDDKISKQLWMGGIGAPDRDKGGKVIIDANGKVQTIGAYATDANGNPTSAATAAQSKVEQKIGAGYLANQKATPKNLTNVRNLASAKAKNNDGGAVMLQSMQQGLTSSSPETRNKMNDNFQKMAYAVASGDDTGSSMDVGSVSHDQNIGLMRVTGPTVGDAIAKHYDDAGRINSLSTDQKQALYQASQQAMRNNPTSTEIQSLNRRLSGIFGGGGNTPPTGGGGAPSGSGGDWRDQGTGFGGYM